MFPKITVRLLLLFASLAVSAGVALGNPPGCLIVAGGPDRSDNQVALESNARYVRSLLPTNAAVRMLYADGKAERQIVQYEDPKSGKFFYRRARLKHIDGPATPAAIRNSILALGKSPSPLLLYFTGHGSPDESNYVDNQYDTWGGDGFAVSDLKKTLQSINPDTPLTLVMVQCFSGAFADAFFEGDSHAIPARAHSCGFFASVAQREASGCTAEVNEADYHDFTTYFFGALSGHDRVGRLISTADYDRDGHVTMDEAYAYALIHDPSIDTPVATSDAYARRFTKMSDAQVFATSYTDVLSYASPSQKAALEALSKQLQLTGNGRLASAYATFMKRADHDEDSVSETEDELTARWIRFVRLAKTVVLEHDIETHGSDNVRAGLAELLASEHGNALNPTN